MLARMDIISVNCPHTPATFHLLSARRLKLIRKDAYVVNTARGEVVDEDTLIKLIESGDIAGCRPRRLRARARGQSEAGAARQGRQGGAAAAYGFGHHRRPRRHGREGDHQYPNLPRQPQAAGPRAAQHAVSDIVTHGRQNRSEKSRLLCPELLTLAASHPRGRRGCRALIRQRTCLRAAPASAIPRQRPRTPPAPAAAVGGSGNTETVPETARTNRRAR